MECTSGQKPQYFDVRTYVRILSRNFAYAVLK